MKPLLLLVLIGATIGPIIAEEDYLQHLLATHSLKEDPTRSKLNLGSDKLYIENVGKEKEFSMTYQLYLPNKGPGEQSLRFPVKMKSPLPEKVKNEKDNEEDPIIDN